LLAQSRNAFHEGVGGSPSGDRGGEDGGQAGDEPKPVSAGVENPQSRDRKEDGRDYRYGN
jgi:hypothetical protein